MIVATPEDCALVAGYIHSITDDSAAPGYRDRVFVLYFTHGKWGGTVSSCIEALPFREHASPAEHADPAVILPGFPGYWRWPSRECEHDLTPDEVGIVKIIAAWVEWPGQGSVATEASEAMVAVGASPELSPWLDFARSEPTSRGAALLDRARKAGVV